MSRSLIFFKGIPAGELESSGGNFQFRYLPEFLATPTAAQISLTLPLQQEPFTADSLFPFFHGLLAEGSQKDLQCQQLKIDPNDAFTRLIKTAHSDTIGAVTVEEIPEAEADAR